MPLPGTILMATILLLLLGLLLLTGGAEFLVRGASALAGRVGLSQLVIGLTVVAFGTSAPELAVSVKAALAGQGGIAMGNVIGSNIFNVAVILGIAALVCPLTVQLKIVRIDMPILLACSLVFTVLLLTGDGLSRAEGAVLAAGLLTYTTWSLVQSRREEAAGRSLALPDSPAAATNASPAIGVGPSILLLLAGLALLVLGARLLVDNATILARHLGINETVIGLTIVAAGTSLPELATSLVAAIRRQTDLALGNIVGSNIFNLLGIAGISALVAPIRPEGIRWQDLGVMLATSLILLPLLRTGFRLVRWEGALLLAAYLAYLWSIWPA